MRKTTSSRKQDTRCITGIFVKTQFERFLKAAKHRNLKDAGGGGEALGAEYK